MILIVLAVACVLTVPLSGGSLARLAQLELRWVWATPLALAVQTVIVSVVPEGAHSLLAAVHVSTYVLIAAFLLLNRRIPGALVIAAGMLSNALAIVANGGVMPAAATAERLAGLQLGSGFHNSMPLAHPHLLWLGDIIPVPGPLPNVLSIGDVAIFGGMLILLHLVCHNRSFAGRRGIELAPVPL